MNDARAVVPLIQKRTEGIQVYPFVCYQNDVKVIPDAQHSYKAYFSTIESLVKTVDMKINGDFLEFSSKQILDLSAGIYKLEIWEIVDDKVHGIYPSSNVKKMKFTVVENALDLPQGTVSSLTLDEFKRELEQYVPHDGGTGGVSGSIDVQKRIVTINGKSIKIPNEVDLTGLASKDDLQGLAKQADLVNYAKRDELPKVNLDVPQRTVEVNGAKLTIPPAIDTSSFITRNELPTVSLNVSSRLLYINGASIKIPSEVDLSDYAQKKDVPQIVYDQSKRSLTINGVAVDLPASVDLSNYYTKAEVDTAINAHKVDLSGYLTIENADKKYTTNAEVQNMIKNMSGGKMPTIYDLSITLADMQRWGRDFPRFLHGDNAPFRIDVFDKNQVQKKAPEAGTDYVKGLDGVIKKLTGYTYTTGEWWASFDYILCRQKWVLTFSDRILSEAEDFDYTNLRYPQRDSIKVYLAPGDLLIDKNHNIFEVGFCWNNYNQKMAQLVQLNRGEGQ